jgi:hypothetical protein
MQATLQEIVESKIDGRNGSGSSSSVDTWHIPENEVKREEKELLGIGTFGQVMRGMYNEEPVACK